MKCKCGYDEFYAYQKRDHCVKVNEHSEVLSTIYIENIHEVKGPFKCINCGAEYPDLSIKRSKLMKVQKDIKEKF